eukprot:114029-Heterocapsa_arctica.AAC.1
MEWPEYFCIPENYSNGCKNDIGHYIEREPPEPLTWSERIGRWPIRGVPIFTQRRSRAPPKAWPAAAAEADKRLSCILRLARLLRLRRHMR